jgi:uncharacterized protein (TIGR02271 family)
MSSSSPRPWSELALLLLAGLAVLIAAAFAGAFDSPQAWTLLAVLAGAYALSRGFARNRWSLPASRGAVHAPARRAHPADGRSEEVAAVTLSAEQLEVDRRRRPHERVTLRKEVVTEYVTVTVPVRREEVRLVRTPIGEDEDVPVSEPRDGDVRELVLMEERAIVDKRIVPRERVRLETDVVTHEEHITETVRHEEAELDREPATHETTEAP